jgi:UDP-N-acetylmuramoyl-L-alanyl-D-glutamate--2,6-diaminopimelate ligase
MSPPAASSSALPPGSAAAASSAPPGSAAAASSAPPGIAELEALGVNVAALALDSRQVRPGDVFLACPGVRQDGRAFIDDAIARGAAAVLWECGDGYRWSAAAHVPNVPVSGLRHRLGELASHVHGHPSRQLWVVAVTGTNGKTSVSRWVAQALSASGRRCAVIGTLGAGFPDEGTMVPLVNTTPDAVTVHAMLARLHAAGARAVALEASSIALEQDRLSGVDIDVAVFTNLTRDHLDYHGTLEAYGEAKALLFERPGLSQAVVNADDAFGRELQRRCRARDLPCRDYSVRAHGSALAAHDLRLDARGLRLEIVAGAERARLQTRLVGAFNAANLLACAGALLASGLTLVEAATALSGVDAPSGRMQPVPVPSGWAGRLPAVIVDYAHTPDALSAALQALRPSAGGARLHCVFGCGGDRDPGKRAPMGEIAARLADEVWVTSDNPRSEAPEAIIAAVLQGTGPGVRVESDRERAIAAAIDAAAPGDVVLLAGKGHETWQEQGGQRLPFDDREVAARCLGLRARREGLA